MQMFIIQESFCCLEQRWHSTFTTDWFQPDLPFDVLSVSKLKPLYMYVNMPAPFQCFFDVVKSISVYSGKEGGGSSIHLIDIINLWALSSRFFMEIKIWWDTFKILGWRQLNNLFLITGTIRHVYWRQAGDLLVTDKACRLHNAIQWTCTGGKKAKKKEMPDSKEISVKQVNKV